MCAKEIIKEGVKKAPVWVKFTLGSALAVSITVGSTVWAIAVRDTTVTNKLVYLDTKIDLVADKVDEVATRQSLRGDKIEEHQREDHDKLIEFGTNQINILNTVHEIKELIKEK